MENLTNKAILLWVADSLLKNSVDELIRWTRRQHEAQENIRLASERMKEYQTMIDNLQGDKIDPFRNCD